MKRKEPEILEFLFICGHLRHLRLILFDQSEDSPMQVDWQGVFPAATTQFKADQSLDLAATLAHLDAMIEAGIDGLIMLGTVGENCSLEYAEKREVLEGRRRPRRRPGAGADGRGRVHHGAGLPLRRRRPQGSASTA